MIRMGGVYLLSRENVITKLQIGIYLLNFAAVCLVAGIMTYSLREIVEVMDARNFLKAVQVRPWRPDTILFTSVTCYLMLVVLSGISQLWEDRGKWVRSMIMIGEIGFCIGTTLALNMNYDGLVLLVVADMIRGQKGGRQKLILLLAVTGLYTITDYNLLGRYFGMVPWDSFISYFSVSTQALLRGTRSIFVSMNLVLFILYMVLLIQGEHREKERIRFLNAQLETANLKLKAYAVEAEKNAETRERNRLAREIHDTLGHVLTGIIAGIDACITLIDISPEETRKRLVKIGDVTRQGITDVRRSVSKLRPDVLEKMELEKALTQMLEDLSHNAKAEIGFDNQVHPLKFHEDEEDVVYRVIQEATTNSIRHGHAENIYISIQKKDQWLTITVKDSGKGCEIIEKGFGLRHMEERLKILGGSLEYEGHDGFLITAKIPIRWGEEYDS